MGKIGGRQAGVGLLTAGSSEYDKDITAGTGRPRQPKPRNG
jgi:hypothetical protein